jgi:hypothetical protein
MVQIHQKEHVLSRTAAKTEVIEKQRLIASLAAIERGEKVSLKFRLSQSTIKIQRQHFNEKISVENQLMKDGGRLRFFVSWISFAFETEGAGNYVLYMLGGIPMTLGINIPVALYDWVSMPFRLRDETIERDMPEDKMVSRTQQIVADCSVYAIRIRGADYPLSAPCRIDFPEKLFVEIAGSQNHLPHYEGMFRYMLVDRKKNEVQMSQVFLKKLSGNEFFERP